MSSDNSTEFQQIESFQKTDSLIEIKIYKLSKDLEILLLETLNDTLEKFQKLNFVPILFTVLKELIINACKANQKRIFFEEKNYDISNKEDYIVGIKEFKKIFSESMGNKFGPLCKKKDYYCLIVFEILENGMIVEIRNNTLIAPQEEKSIREKLANAMKYDDLAGYYMDNADNTEGAGLGLALIVIMLKSENIDPNFFRISITKEYTSARLELPFDQNYKSRRD